MLPARRRNPSRSRCGLLLLLLSGAAFAACGDIHDLNTVDTSGGMNAAAGSDDGGAPTAGATGGGTPNRGGSVSALGGMPTLGAAGDQPASGAGGEAIAGNPGSSGNATAGDSTIGGSNAGAGGASGGAAGASAMSGGAGGGSGGDAGSGGGAAGGVGGAAPIPYCESRVEAVLPYTVADGFKYSQWSSITEISVVPQGSTFCSARAAGAVGDCVTWTYTPDAVNPTPAWVTWSRAWDPQYTHPPVCLPATVTSLTFVAKGASGGEVIYVSALGLPFVPYTLTTSWQPFAFNISIANPNTPADGVEAPFVWKAQSASAETFAIDSIVIH